MPNAQPHGGGKMDMRTMYLPQDDFIDEAGWYTVYDSYPAGQTSPCLNIVDGPYETRAEAQAQIDEAMMADALERHHRAQYDHACGYVD